MCQLLARVFTHVALISAGMPLNKGKKGGGLDQSQRLYDEPGQFNPRAAKADKKRRKKQKKAGVSAGDEVPDDMTAALASLSKIKLAAQEA